MLAGIRRILVTGPHRSGTTIASEIIAAELNLPAIRECDIAHPRWPGDDEPRLDKSDVLAVTEGVLQGATTYKWLPDIAKHFDAIVVVRRDGAEILRSQKRYRGRYLDDPSEKYRQLRSMHLPFVIWIEYEALSKHPLFYEDRTGWESRQTSPS